jgi:hypothetical protein
MAKKKQQRPMWETKGSIVAPAPRIEYQGNSSILCRNCGYPGTKHGSAQNPVRPYACPANGAEPKWPHSIKDDKKAGALYDKRLDRFWRKRTTRYEPVRY